MEHNTDNNDKDSKESHKEEKRDIAEKMGDVSGKKPKIVYFIRHGSTPLNEDSDRFCGSTDVFLSKTGNERIHKIAGELNGILSVNHIIASPLRRTVETAEILSKALSVPYITNNNIREIDFGEWEKLTKAEINEKYPSIYQQWLIRSDVTTPPKGESPYDVAKRAITFKNQIMEEEEPVLVVAHKTFLRIAICTWLSIPLKSYRHVFNIYGGALGCIHFYPIESKLALLNWMPGHEFPRLTKND
ncbi:MAG: histidine phosphatase family protein [Candidatus Omnitrophota bacterium]